MNASTSGVGRTRDRKYVFAESGSHTTNECRFLLADDPQGTFTLMAPRVDDQEYYPDHRDGLFFIRTNDVTDNFRLVTAPVATPGREQWTEIYRGGVDVPLEDFDVFAGFCVLSERKAGLPTLTVYDLAGRAGLVLRGRSGFRSRPIRRVQMRIASSRRRAFAIATRRWLRLLRCTTMTWPRVFLPC